MKIKIIVSTILGLVLSGCNSTGGTVAPSSTIKALTTMEIKELFIGKTSSWVKRKNGQRFKLYSAPNAEMHVYYTNRNKAGETRILKWSIENNEHCGYRNGKSFCGKIIPQGNGTYHKVSDGIQGATISDFVKGKQLKK